MILVAIAGTIPSKKNTQRISKHGGIYKQQDVRDYEDLVAWSMIKSKGALLVPFGIRGTFTIAKRKDLDNALTTVLDSLQLCGVIRNDKDLMHISDLKKVPANKRQGERCDLELYPLTPAA